MAKSILLLGIIAALLTIPEWHGLESQVMRIVRTTLVVIWLGVLFLATQGHRPSP